VTKTWLTLSAATESFQLGRPGLTPTDCIASDTVITSMMIPAALDPLGADHQCRPAQAHIRSDTRLSDRCRCHQGSDLVTNSLISILSSRRLSVPAQRPDAPNHIGGATPSR